MTFRIVPSGFELDGHPLRVLSGGLHYFRVLPEQWPHRLRMLRAMGLNTVETYVPWNFHEPRPGTYDFDGMADLEGFLAAAADAGLFAIVRPSPYICAEWENGGLPWWLLAEPGMRLRTCDPAYLAHVERWYDEVIPRIAVHQISRGGNVLMLQIENEYGSFGSDTAYLDRLGSMMRERGIDVPMVTSDGPEDFMLTGGTLPDATATVNFGSRPEEAFAELARLRPDDPAMCMEFWCGWFDHWGEHHTVRDPDDAAGTLRRILEAGASVNLYMAHGGTNFGTWAGANRGEPMHAGAYQPTVTSYDYDAPIDERGAPTPKFTAFRDILTPYAGTEPLPAPPELPPLLAPCRVRLTESVRLFDVLDAIAEPAVHSPVPPSFEELGIAHGLVHYTATIPGPRRPQPLTLEGLADRAHLFVDGEPVTVLERDADLKPPQVAAGSDGARIALLVESMGRVNYGPRLGDRKGVSGVLHHQQYVHGWTARAVPLDGPLPELPWRADAVEASVATGPVFLRGFLDAAEPADAYIAVPAGTKGYLWVNGFCLGRYWERGPQHTLYLPWPLLRAGRNEIVVLELDGLRDPFVEVLDAPDLG